MKSQASASSSPAPSAKPLTAAMIGTRSSSIKSRHAVAALGEGARARRDPAPAIALMSAPATNARSPAPVRIAQRTPVSRSIASNAAVSASTRRAVERVARLGAVDGQRDDRAVARRQHEGFAGRAVI